MLLIWLNSDGLLVSADTYPRNPATVVGGRPYILAPLSVEEVAVILRGRRKMVGTVTGGTITFGPVKGLDGDSVRTLFRTAANRWVLPATPWPPGKWPPPVLQGFDPPDRDKNAGIQNSEGGPPVDRPRQSRAGVTPPRG